MNKQIVNAMASVSFYVMRLSTYLETTLLNDLFLHMIGFCIFFRVTYLHSYGIIDCSGPQNLNAFQAIGLDASDMTALQLLGQQL